MIKCKYCNRSFEGFSASAKANHSRWCLLNPKIDQYKKDQRDRLQKVAKERTPESYLKCAEKIKKLHKEGRYDDRNIWLKKNPTFLGKHHTVESKQKIREGALKSPHRRLLKSTREYKKKDGSFVLLDSSWEEALAKRLDFLNIEWVRPSFIWYTLEGESHKYYPDFYLPDSNIYLDPKNPQALRVQQGKLKILEKILPNLVILKSLKECEEYTI